MDAWKDIYTHDSLLETKDGMLWMGSFGGLLKKNGDRWAAYERHNFPFASSRIIGFLEASDDALWIAQRNGGVFRVERGHSRWLSYDQLRFQCETEDGVKWFDCREGGGGCVRYDGETWVRYGVEDGLMSEIREIFATHDGEIWAVGQHQDLAATARFHPSEERDQAWQLETHPKLAPLIPNGAIFESADGAIWIGGSNMSLGLQFQGGIMRYGFPLDGDRADARKKTWKHYTSKESPAPTYVWGIAQTPKGDIWVGGGSFHRFDGQEWTTVLEPAGLAQVSQNEVYCDTLGELWVGTGGNGIMHYDETQNVWTQYSIKDGLPDGVVLSILRSRDGTVWASTDKGFSRFDGRSWTPYVLPKTLPRGRVNHQAKDGAIWIRLDSQTIRYMPDVRPPETEILTAPQEVSEKGQTTLTWKGVDPWRTTSTEALQYAWRLDEGAWSSFSLETSAFFTGLSYGQHKFEVKARDLDFNQDPTPAGVAFVVIAPIWRQLWFLVLVSVLGSLIGLQTIRVLRRDIRLREQTERKSVFMSAMSHEIRTPLTSIKGYTDNMLDGIGGALTERQRHTLTRVEANANALLVLVNDLLDLSKIEAGRMDVASDVFRIRDFVKVCCDTVRPLVKPMVNLRWEIADGIEDVCTDQGKLRQIVTNLLSNALKYSDDGDVVLGIEKNSQGKMLNISVTDMGIGIPKDALAKIFDEYQQVKGSDKYGKGTGLGLPITKKLVELLGGSISVASEVGKGSTFTVRVLAVYPSPDKR